MRKWQVLLSATVCTSCIMPALAQEISVRAGYGADAEAEKSLNDIAEPVVHAVPAGVHPHEIARKLCGRVSPTYVSMLAQANPNRVIAAKPEPASYSFPACFILRARSSIVPLEGETVAGLAERIVGTAGPRTIGRIVSVNNRFRNLKISLRSSGIESMSLGSTDPVIVPNSTEPAVYKLRPIAAVNAGEALDRLRQAIGAADRPEWIAAADEVALESGVDPRLSQPVECPSAAPPPRPDSQWPFDRAALISALARNDERRAALGLDPVRPVTIAVADNGVDGLFEVFTRDLLAINPGETPNDRIDNEPNGFIDDIVGVNVFSGRAPSPLEGQDPWHGTHLAGLLLGGKTLPAELAGTSVLPRLRLLPISMVEERREGSLSTGNVTFYRIPVKGVLDAFRYAKHRRAAVVNFSVSTREKLPSLEGELSLSKEMLLVAAAGNQATHYDAESLFPAAYGGVQHEAMSLPVISVGAHDRRGCLAAFSGRGSGRVDIAAPGTAIESYGLNGEVKTVDGTSQATAIVSFVAGLLAAEGLTDALAIRHRLLASVDLHPGLSEHIYSQGSLNVVKAVSRYDDVLELNAAPGFLRHGRLAAPLTPREVCPQVAAAQGKVLKVARHPTLLEVMRVSIRWNNNNKLQFLDCRPTLPSIQFVSTDAAVGEDIPFSTIKDLVLRN